MKTVAVLGAFDDLKARDVRFLEEASKLGAVRVWLWSDEVVAALTGQPPKFPFPERHYLLQAIRYVSCVEQINDSAHSSIGNLSNALNALPTAASGPPDIWAVPTADANDQQRVFCAEHGIEYAVFAPADLAGFPESPNVADHDGHSSCVIRHSSSFRRPTVIVTGCYDWLHSGHVRFFEEVSELGDLLVAVGNDANVRHLKGAGHPLQTQDERRYMVGAIRYVTEALITSGHGWMDAEPDIARLKPDMYAVNEDGDHPEKRAFCQAHGLKYAVLKRTPKAGLARRSSTDLRGF
jgi:cytidyltransferase-like protein